MLYQDTLTGYLYEVPETQLSQGSPVMYDGLGNPLGLPFLAPIIGALAPAAGSLISNLFSRRSSAPAAPSPAACPAPAAPSIISSLLPAVGSLISRVLPGLGALPPVGQTYVGGAPADDLAEYYNPYGYSSWYQQPAGQSGYQQYQQYQQWPYQSGYQSWGYPGWYRRY